MGQPIQRLPRQPKIPSITIDQFHLGGISDSPYSGIKKSNLSMVGFDVYNTPGLLVSSQKMTIETGAPTDDYYKILPCSDGNIYLFGKVTGKVYKNASGTYTLLGTTAPGGAAGSNGVLDAVQFNGFIYYAMWNKLGQWDFTMAFSARNDTFATFSAGSSVNHPMLNMPNDLTLYIGDQWNLAQVDSTNTFTASALVFTHDIIINCLGKQVTDLLIGTQTNNKVTNGHVFRWDTWSIAPINDYPIPESSVNAFLQADDATIIVQAGNKGKLYYLNSSLFQPISRIPPIFPTLYTPSNTMTVNYPATANLNGVPLVGVSNSAGNPCYQGVYAYGSLDINYPQVLTLPYPISTGSLNNVTIWSLATVGQTLYISSYDGNSSTYQIDKLDYNNKFNGSFFETQLVRYSRIWLDNFDKAIVNYQSVPTGTSIAVSYDANWQGYVSYTMTNDIDRNEYIAVADVRAKTIKFKVATTASGNNAPTIEDLIIYPT